jgi:phage shock protein PspC (stress-responsive transcriptional regulator)
MNCNDAVAALVASLENGTPMTDAQREHIRTCERCRELLDSAKQFEATLGGNGITAPSVEDALVAVEGEVHRKRSRRVIGVLIGIMAMMALGVGLMLVRFDAAGEIGFWLFAAGVAVLSSAGLAIPVLLIIYVVRSSAERRIYRRLGRGRMISGVCLGIAEKMNMDVFIVRLIFLALMILAGGFGFWLYVALNVAMPVHPDDRQYLLRFRLRRWWAQRNRHADYDAG